MTGNADESREALEFIRDKIDSVPHLEALLLLWNSRPRTWTEEELAARLYVDPNEARKLLDDLSQASLAANRPAGYCYESRSPEQDRLITLVDSVYRRELVRVTSMIHSKAPSSVRDFARAFRFKKERE